MMKTKKKFLLKIKILIKNKNNKIERKQIYKQEKAKIFRTNKIKILLFLNNHQVRWLTIK